MTIPEPMDWRGLYPHDQAFDDVLFPRQRVATPKTGQAALFGEEDVETDAAPNSIQHPAKMSLYLLRRILAEMQERGWLKPGDCVVDPFGGRGSTAAVWCAQDERNRAVTIELEPPFVAMQRAVKAGAEKRLGRPLWWEVLQGDSRKADELLRECGVGVTSPPYGQTEIMHIGHSIGDAWAEKGQSAIPAENGDKRTRRYGFMPGQIGQMPDRDPVSILSPPYADQNANPSMGVGLTMGNARHGRVDHHTERLQNGGWGYGQTEGQIGNLPDREPSAVTVRWTGPTGQEYELRVPAGEVEAVWAEIERLEREWRENRPVAVLSPPYGQGVIAKVDVEKLRALTQDPTSSLYGRNPEGAWFQAMAQGYVNSPGNIDNLGDVASVTSPPYERAFHGDAGIDESKLKKAPGANPQYRQCRGNGGYTSITSPPYEDSLASDDPEKRGGLFRDPKRANDRTLTGNYRGVTSPPYEEAQSGGGLAAAKDGNGYHATTRLPGSIYRPEEHGTSVGQIGATQGETYADACLGVYSALARAGVRYLATVTKNPTRDGKLRRLDLLTADLLERAGYRIVAYARAWLWETEAEVQSREGQERLDDELPADTRPTGRLSFFKRLHVAKGAPAAQFEDVFLCELVPPVSAPSLPPLTRTNAVLEWDRLREKRKRQPLSEEEQARFAEAGRLVDVVLGVKR